MVKDVSSFLKKNRISATCNICGAECYIKLAKKDISKWEGIGNASCGAYQKAESFWTCEKCGKKNHTRLIRNGSIFFTNPFANWYGDTFSVD